MRTSFFLVLTAATILSGGMPAGAAAVAALDTAATGAFTTAIHVAIAVCGSTGCYMPQTRAVRQRKVQSLGRG